MRFLPLLSSLTLLGGLHAQPLSSHQWDNRVLMVLTPDLGSECYREQLDLWRKDPIGLMERKLVIYHVLPGQFALEDPSRQEDSLNWETGHNLYQKFDVPDSAFQLLLVGLDGTVKLQQSHLLSLEQLFRIIDGMPMRRRELRAQRNWN